MVVRWTVGSIGTACSAWIQILIGFWMWVRFSNGWMQGFEPGLVTWKHTHEAPQELKESFLLPKHLKCSCWHLWFDLAGTLHSEHRNICYSSFNDFMSQNKQLPPPQLPGYPSVNEIAWGFFLIIAVTRKRLDNRAAFKIASYMCKVLSCDLLPETSQAGLDGAAKRRRAVRSCILSEAGGGSQTVNKLIACNFFLWKRVWSMWCCYSSVGEKLLPPAHFTCLWYQVFLFFLPVF